MYVKFSLAIPAVLEFVAILWQLYLLWNRTNSTGKDHWKATSK